MASHNPQVAVIVLCWNNRDLLEECLNSAYAQTYPNVEIVLVDNGSTDDSVAYVKEYHPKVTLIETGDNLGFAVGNNIGIRRALEDDDCQYIMLLNTDATLEPDWVEKMVAFALKHPKLASVQSPTMDYYDHAVLDSCGILIDQHALATQIGYRQTNVKLETTRVFGVNAAAALFSRAFLEAQPFGDDYLDHDLWMYLEDVDLSTRAVMMGWESWLLDESRAYHMGSASSGKNPGFSLYMTYRNNALVLIKNLPWRIIWRILPGLLGAEFHRLRGLWREGKYSQVKAIVKGRFDSLSRIPIFLRKRKYFKKYWNIGEAALWKMMELPKLRKILPSERPFGTEAVTVIVLSHNNLGRLESCLKAIIDQGYPNLRVIIVDNASTDGSVEYIEANYPEIILLAQKYNLGVPNGFNVGLTKALMDEPDYFAFIQANTVIDPDWLEVMVKTMREQPRAFSVASKLLSAAPDSLGEVVLNQGYSYHPVDGPQPAKFKAGGVHEVFASSDLAAIYRIEGLGAMGMMDGDFFTSLEDVDYCFRARLMGHLVYSQPAAKARVALAPATPGLQWYHAQKNLIFIYLKNLPFKLFWRYLPQVAWRLLRDGIYALLHGLAWQQAKAILKGLFRLPRMLRYRHRINIRRRLRAAEIAKAFKLPTHP